MAAPNYEQIQSFNGVKQKLMKSAIAEFTAMVGPDASMDEAMDVARSIARRYAKFGAELGAQWYDLCTELAGIRAERAVWSETSDDDIDVRAQSAAKGADGKTGVFADFLSYIINDSIQRTGSANLWRDYERGLSSGKWARVPVGETCAWCLMLASQGAWYVSEESALGKFAGHYHKACNCVAVFHAAPESIGGYEGMLADYKRKYYESENVRESGDMSDELRERIARAKAAHKEAYDKGETDVKWTQYNETLIIMRYRYGLN